MLILGIIAGMLASLLGAVWVHKDAISKGRSAESADGWMAVVLFFFGIAFPIYLIVRTGWHPPAKTCLSCGQLAAARAGFCAACGAALSPTATELPEGPSSSLTGWLIALVAIVGVSWMITLVARGAP